MRPRDRNDSHAVLDVPDDVHACAFLQHHRHAQEINICFRGEFRCRRIFSSDCCFCCRFDGVVVDPEQDVVDVPTVGDTGIPPFELHLYNSIGTTCMDLQYDPMTLLRRGRPCNSKSNALNENKIS